MKKSLLPIIGLMAGLLVACGGGNSEAPSNNASSKGGAASSQKTSKASSSKHTHTYDETKWESDANNHWHPATCEHTSQKGSSAAHDFEEVAAECVEATCKAAGKKVEKCKVCGYKKETEIPAGMHNYEAAADVVVEGNSTYKVQTCKTCGAKDVTVDATKYVTLEGSLKDAPDASVKLGKNDNYVEYKFNIDKAFTGKAYLYGWVDYFKDGSNNNDQRGFFSGKNSDGSTPNFTLEVNGTNVEVTNKKTYEEMGMGSRDDGSTNSTPALCEVGEASFAAGEVTFKYTRTESYNLNVLEFHFIGELK